MKAVTIEVMCCKDCNTNPSLNDDSLGIKWIQGGVIMNHKCGCTIEGRGFTNFPLHIHYCPTHQANEMLVANVHLLVKLLSSTPDQRNRMERDAEIATGGNLTALEAIVESLKLYLPPEPVGPALKGEG